MDRLQNPNENKIEPVETISTEKQNAQKPANNFVLKFVGFILCFVGSVFVNVYLAMDGGMVLTFLHLPADYLVSLLAIILLGLNAYSAILLARTGYHYVSYGIVAGVCFFFLVVGGCFLHFTYNHF